MTIQWTKRHFQETITQPLAQADKGSAFFENNIVPLLLGLSGAVFLAVVGILFIFIHPSEVLTVLHYNVYFGVDLLGAWWQVYILPGVAWVFVALNTVLAYYLYTKNQERIAAYLFLLGSLMLMSGVVLGCIAIAYINY